MVSAMMRRTERAMGIPGRILRHLRLSRGSHRRSRPASPPFLILFINSICNLACDHCFYWKELNQRDDLTNAELEALSKSLGRIENLNLSGGEPFLREDFAEVVGHFIRNNGVRRVYCPTNGYFAERTISALEELFRSPTLDSFTAELSLDGMPEFHDAFRGNPRSFEKAMETYDALAELQSREPRLSIHANSTATGENVDEIKRLTTFLHDRCPRMEHHNIAMLRGERKRPTLTGPGLQAYRELIDYVRELWSDREAGRHGGIVEPMLHWGKLKIARAQAQAIPCTAGLLTGVVYANGDVSVCEQHDPIGNLRSQTFPEIWNSPRAQALRDSIACKDCFCTNEVFLWPSIVFRPLQLLKAYWGSRAWRRPAPLPPENRVDWTSSAPPSRPHDAHLGRPRP